MCSWTELGAQGVAEVGSRAPSRDIAKPELEEARVARLDDGTTRKRLEIDRLCGVTEEVGLGDREAED